MKIQEFAEYIGLKLLVEKISKRRFQARFEDTEVFDGTLLVSDCGYGKTQVEAVADYCRRIQAKKLVFKAYTPNERRYVTAPGRLEA